MVSSVIVSRPSARSNHAKNSASAAPSCSIVARTCSISAGVLRDFANVDGFTASITRTCCGTACSSPYVTRRGSISSPAPSGSAASAAAAASYGFTSTPSRASDVASSADTLPSATNSVARSRPTSACATNTGL